MTIPNVPAQIGLGEDSRRQFKSNIRNAESLAAEMAAFANSAGGTIFIGVADDGTLPGLALEDVSRINQLISNAASQLVRNPLTVLTENVVLESGRIIIVLRVPASLDKPYFDKNGVMWLKCGADKRRVNSKEELRRLFQISDQFHADELPAEAWFEVLEKLRFRDFPRDVYKREFPEAADELIKNAEIIASTVAGLSQVLAWLVTKERVSLVALRSQLLQLDQFPGAFIDEINERALEESGEEIIIAKEVLFEVIANLE